MDSLRAIESLFRRRDLEKLATDATRYRSEHRVDEDGKAVTIGLTYTTKSSKISKTDDGQHLIHLCNEVLEAMGVEEEYASGALSENAHWRPHTDKNNDHSKRSIMVTCGTRKSGGGLWIWEDGDQAVVVDPAVAAPVRQWLLDRELTLLAILQTHHHADHIGGTPDLLQTWPDADVIAAAADRARIPFQTRSVADGDEVDLMGHTLQVMDVAAHTAAHIAFYLADQSIGPVVFCGDTLFAGGCGRLFEGTPEQMHTSLQTLRDLPDNTAVYCAHEYTQANGRFALSVEPTNPDLIERMEKVKTLRKENQPTLPTQLDVELQTNPFLRTHSEAIRRQLELEGHSDLQVFTRLRQLKDNF